MRLFLLILAWALLLTSCKEVTYKEAQPAGFPALKEIPPNLRGIFQAYDQTTGDFSDTLIIESWGYHMRDKKDKEWLGKGTLSDTLVVKFYQNYYFVNFKFNDQWVLRLIKQHTDGSFEFLSIDLQDDAKGKEKLAKISKKLKVSEHKRKDDTFYQINPTPKQLMALIKEGYFTGAKLTKIK
ncbi:MAG TPA: hypothetical protein VL728_14855 [Cyclobacteriaceae bacterium]|jgi:hypothetical protein|nr:hypothetical protein [Cyclobacteriaceae bacterium]